jgi:hypothetical protein
MRTHPRREFTTADIVEIVQRATDKKTWQVHCERCGAWCKSPRDRRIDHIIPEAMRPYADMWRKLTPRDGQLFCIPCHDKFKTPRDMGDIAEAKRREAAELGIERPGKAKIARRKKPERQPYRPPAGEVAMSRRYR